MPAFNNLFSFVLAFSTQLNQTSITFFRCLFYGTILLCRQTSTSQIIVPGNNFTLPSDQHNQIIVPQSNFTLHSDMAKSNNCSIEQFYFAVRCGKVKDFTSEIKKSCLENYNLLTFGAGNFIYQISHSLKGSKFQSVCLSERQTTYLLCTIISCFGRLNLVIEKNDL